jgi:16S rRNA (adenine1518-N6/adenine1519-N6)-dimethyltransferase
VTEELLGARAVRDALRRHGVRPSRALGQNFVIDPNTIRKVCEVAALDRRASVLEVGAGAGSLTVALARRARRVIAVELDDALVDVLHDTLRGLVNVTVIKADALEADLGSLGATDLVANLPYNIAVAVVVRALRTAPRVRALTVMTQREVGERLAAPPGGRTYGQASVVVSFFAEAHVAARVSRHAFYPVPRVESVVVRMERRTSRPKVDEAMFTSVVRAAFAQRRKTVRNSMASVAGSVKCAEKVLEEAGVDPGVRAEELDVGAFVALARVLDEGRAGRGSPAQGLGRSGGEPPPGGRGSSVDDR